MTETLYLVISRPQKRAWRGPRIELIKRKRPALARPSEQALVRLCIDIPDGILQPRTVQVAILPEHIITPVVTAKSTPL